MKRFCRLFIFLIVLSGWIPNLAAAQVVNMPDASLAAVVRAELGLAPNAPITRQALQNLKELLADNFLDRNRIRPFTGGVRIKDLTGLEHATELRSLRVSFHNISDLGPLKGLKQLTNLRFTGNQVSDLGPLTGLTQLSLLWIGSNPLIDFSPLAGKQLWSLSVSVRSEALMDNLRRHVDLDQLGALSVDGDRNQIGDLRPFANLTQLVSFGFSSAQIRDVKPLTGLTQLDSLRLTGNQIHDVTPLAGLTQLRYLYLSGNQIHDVKPLASFTQLRVLDLRNNQIRDVTPIQHLIDSPSTGVLLEGNPIGEPPEMKPDLVVESIQIKPSSVISEKKSDLPATVAPGTSLRLSVIMKNEGTSTSEGTRVYYFESEDKTFPKSKERLRGTQEDVTISTKGIELALKFKAPKTAGTYYYRACVDRVLHEEKTDNNCSAAVEIRVGNMKPDLVVHVIKSEDATYKHIFENTADIYANVDLSEPEPASKPSFKFRVIVKNQGDRKSDPTELQLYYASNKDVSEKGKPLKVYQIKKIPSLEPNQVSKKTWTISVPSGGYHYYGTKVEGGKYESDSGNNWSVPVKVHAVVTDLELPENLISDVALTPNATYFVVNAQFPKLLVKNQNRATYGSCVITLGIPGVSDTPLKEWDETHSLLKGDPLYFMFPLLSAQQRIDALGGTYDLDTTEVVIGAIGTAVGVGAGIKVLRYIPVIPLGKVGQSIDELAKVVLRIGSKFKVLIPTVAKVTVEGASGAAGRYVVSKVIGKTTNFLTATGLRTVSNLTGGDEEEPSIEDELLAFTAAPILILTPTLEQQTQPTGEARYLFRIPKQLTEIKVTEIDITVEQVYFVGDKAYTAKYQGVYPLEGAAAAPGLAPMSLSDYPPFQWLSPEAQEYLLRDFGMFTSAETWQVPATTALLPNYPNPFNPETWIPYQLAKAADVMLTIYDIHGHVVRDLDLGHQRAGTYHGRSRAAYWDGRNAQGEPVASGIYFYTLKVGDFTATRKMLIRK